jgi:pimeloyl-ACP methyl ester carboxylesterase
MQTSYYPFKSAAAEQEYVAYYTATAAKLWPVPYENIFIKTCCGPTYARVSGPKGAPALVLLPGINATSLMWAPNVAAWSKSYRVYAVDLLNDYGLSRDSRVIWKSSQFLEWLDDYFNQLGLTQPFNLLGMSYGGWLAAMYGVARPERLRKLVLIAPGAAVLRMHWSFLRRSALAGILGGQASSELFHWLFADGVAHPESCLMDINDFGNCLYMGHQCVRQRFFVYPTVLSDKEWAGAATAYVVPGRGARKIIRPAARPWQGLRRVAPQVQTSLTDPGSRPRFNHGAGGS